MGCGQLHWYPDVLIVDAGHNILWYRTPRSRGDLLSLSCLLGILQLLLLNDDLVKVTIDHSLAEQKQEMYGRRLACPSRNGSVGRDSFTKIWYLKDRWLIYRFRGHLTGSIVAVLWSLCHSAGGSRGRCDHSKNNPIDQQILPPSCESWQLWTAVFFQRV